MIRRFLLAAGLLAMFAATAMAEECPAPGPEADLRTPLPRFAAAVASGGPIEVLAVGLGNMRSGGMEGPFANAFREALERGLPGRTLRVTVVPTPGMLAKDAADRVRRGVAEGEPALVVWRTGLADALAVTDPARFRRIVQRAAAWISAQNADLVLVDLAYTGAGAHEPTYRRYVDALAQVGRDGEAAVFRRYAITEAWYRAGVAPGQMADSEACLAQILAAAILRQAAP
jgi:hypothetical protein